MKPKPNRNLTLPWTPQRSTRESEWKPSLAKKTSYELNFPLMLVIPAYGTLRNETKRNETKRNGTLRNGTLRNGTLRNSTLRNGTLRNGTLRNGTLRNGNR